MTLATVTVHCVGREQEPVAVIDHFAPAPDALRAAAAGMTFAPGDNHYPGIKAPVHESYMSDQGALLGKIMREVFGITDRVAVLDVGYALVTTPPSDLTLEQRIPHVDGLEPGRVALIHYLVPHGCNGTAFYRHHATGYETIDRGRSARYFASLNDDLRTHGQPPPVYLDGDSPIFERIGHFAGTYNRALVYRGRLLHSGAIAAENSLSADPAAGRLTITGFFAAS